VRSRRKHDDSDERRADRLRGGEPTDDALPGGTALTALVAFAREIGDQATSGSTSPRESVAEALAALGESVCASPAETAAAALTVALQTPRLLMADPRTSCDAVMRLLYLFAPIRQASVWSETSTDPLHVVTYVGPPPSRRVEAVAYDTMRPGGQPDSARATIYGVPIRGIGSVLGAIVFRAAARDVGIARAAAEEAAETLAPVLARERMLVRAADQERVLLETGERRLRRLALDLHDGPLQDLAGLRFEIALLRAQAQERAGEDEVARLLAARLDDVEARTVGADDLLRDICKSIVGPAIPDKPLELTLREEAGAFAVLTDADVDLDLNGSLDDLTPSARLALVRIVQEALTNVREHSAAGHVRITVHGAAEAVRAEIVDDGSGFDAESTLAAAVRDGRLGLAGIVERARLLGGTATISSRDGGPTRIEVVLPRWRPLARS
jgi:signal transduction histidine kinase